MLVQGVGEDAPALDGESETGEELGFIINRSRQQEISSDLAVLDCAVLHIR
jgi:hypothetical protein